MHTSALSIPLLADLTSFCLGAWRRLADRLYPGNGSGQTSTDLGTRSRHGGRATGWSKSTTLR
jgi:hypothetical protein